MNHKKNTGAYYTPSNIAKFMMGLTYAKMKSKRKLSILEPSAGDGVFLEALIDAEPYLDSVEACVAIEPNSSTSLHDSSKFSNQPFEIICSDFFDFDKSRLRKFDLIIGNPPYISRRRLSKGQIEKCQSSIDFAPEFENFKNIWIPFVVKSLAHLKDDGVLCFVLPSDLLQSTIAEKVRSLLLDNFERVEILTFSEPAFRECKDQDTLVLIASKSHNKKGLFFGTIANSTNPSPPTTKKINQSSISSTKWTRFLLTNDEIELLENLRGASQSIGDFCTSRPGVVTGANSFFILSPSEVAARNLGKYVKPIVHRGGYVNGHLEFSKSDFQEITHRNRPSYLLSLGGYSQELPSEVQDYLRSGEGADFQQNYKISKRQSWYIVPDSGSAPQALFFKRCHEYPKLLINSAEVITTDSAYWVNPKEGASIDAIVFSFYNSLTLLFAELDGRHFGGGVLELTPSEFKSLPIPYQTPSDGIFLEFSQRFGTKRSIDEFLNAYDPKILKNFFPQLELEKIALLNNIKCRLTKYRTE